MANINRKKNRRRVHFRIRKKVEGTEVRPRLAVHFSNKNIYAQLIDDTSSRTLCAASTIEKGGRLDSGDNCSAAKEIGTRIAEKAKTVGVTSVVFDRNGYRFHGRVKALADGAREGGLKF